MHPADRALERLYAQVPDSGCKGLCQEGCGPIGMSQREHFRVLRAGYDIPPPSQALAAYDADNEWSCPALTADGRCGAHKVRPMLCRLYGSTDGLRCAHGCGPRTGYLPDKAAYGLLNQSLKIGGQREP